MKEHKKYAVSPEDKPEFIGQIIDIFEDFLEERGGLSQPNYEKDEDEEDTNVNIYGSDYDQLYEKITDTLQNWGIIQKDKTK